MIVCTSNFPLPASFLCSYACRRSSTLRSWMPGHTLHQSVKQSGMFKRAWAIHSKLALHCKFAAHANKTSLFFQARSKNGRPQDMFRALYRVGPKMCHFTFVHIFAKYQLIFKIISLVHSVDNKQQRDYWISYHTLTMSLHYLVKYKCEQTNNNRQQACW